MNKFFIVALATGTINISVHGQKIKEWQVPAAAKAAFQKQYPGAKGNWDKEDLNYEVNFKLNSAAMSAIIDKNGTIVETETNIPVNELPQAVQVYMKEHYRNMKLKEAARIVKANGDVNYEAELAHKDIVFDGNGKFIKEEKE